MYFIKKNPQKIKAAAFPRLSPLSLSLFAGMTALLPSVTDAATITVTTALGNTAGCTLREAIISANTTTNQNNGCAVGSASGTDTIVFSNSLASPNNTISLYRGLFISAKDIEIDASAVSGGITIKGDEDSRLALISNSKVTLNRLTFTEGGESGADDRNGSAILIDYEGGSAMPSNVTFNNCSIHNNANVSVKRNPGYGNGGGIAVNGYATVNFNNTTITNNTATSDGGGIYASDYAQVIATNSVISGNTTLVAGVIGDGVTEYDGNNGFGGGVNLTDQATFTAINTTIANNASARGGAINHGGGLVNLDRVTLSGNTATVNGGTLRMAKNAQSLSLSNSTVSSNTSPRATAIFVIGSSTTVDITSSTISANRVTDDGSTDDGSDTAGIVALNGQVTLTNTIVANSIGGGDCFRRDTNNVSPDASSIIEDGRCGAQRAGDPGLRGLAFNGGRTATHALRENSIALDTANTGRCPVIDQRGEQRDDNCDVGSFELNEEDLNQDKSSFFVVPTKNGKALVFNL